MNSNTIDATSNQIQSLRFGVEEIAPVCDHNGNMWRNWRQCKSGVVVIDNQEYRFIQRDIITARFRVANDNDRT